MIFSKPKLVSFLLGGLSALAFAPIFFFPILAISFTGLLILISNSVNLKQCFLIGWCFGFGMFLAGLYWISFALLVDIGSFAWLIPFAVFAIPAILAIYVGFIAVLSKLFSKNSYQIVLNFVLIWVLFEIVRVNLFSGYPWLVMGYSLAFSDESIQVSSVLGVYGLSLIVVFSGCSLYPYIIDQRRNKLTLFVMAILIAIVNYGYGALRLHRNVTEYSSSLVRVVQGNIPQDVHARFDQKLKNIQILADLSAPNHNNFDYVIWPEGAIDFPLSIQSKLQFSNFIPENGYLLSGVLRVDDDDHIRKIWNSVFVINSFGEVVKYYDKRHLVPFGEYIPFKSFLPVTKITQGALDFSKGNDVGQLSVDARVPSFVPLICYEAYFAEDVGKISKDSKFLVNFTNDAWYGTSSGPYQHLYMTKLRAVERGLPMIRAANTGISAIYDSYGREVAKLQLNSRGVIDSNVPLVANKSTFYNKYGNNIVFLMIALALSAINYRILTKLIYTEKGNESKRKIINSRRN